jgi:alkanesulfonate monooxygenase SsuD/methylene tetrahydromethanopterin reductase-like flavin-dependent oxidoreductase (luciferase family)
LLTAVVADTWSDAEPRTRLAAQMRAQRGRKLNWKAGEAHDKLSPSRPTLVMRADTPEAASLAAERADVARVTAATREEADAKSRSLKDAASNNGRDPASLKVLTDLTVTLAKAPEHAEARKDLAEEMLGHRLGGAGARYVGTPPGLAETCAEWVAAGASDGFTLLPTSLPTDLILVAEEVTPVLARWGHTRGGYPPPARKMILSRKAATEGAPQRGGAPARISP